MTGQDHEGPNSRNTQRGGTAVTNGAALKADKYKMAQEPHVKQKELRESSTEFTSYHLTLTFSTPHHSRVVSL